MRIIICEDAKEDQTLLISHCLHFQRERQTQLETIVYQNAGQMLADEAAIHADALFLDIYMEGTTGVKAAKIMRSKGYAGAIVFATNSMQHYAEGYEVEAIHYLIKPVTYPAFAEAMRRILALYKAAVRMITVNYGKQQLHIPVDSIHYAEVYDHKTILHTGNGDLVISQSLSALENILGGHPFLRCYRCYIIHMDYVEKMKNTVFLMKDGSEIPIARDKRGELKKQYVSYIFQRMEES